MGSKKPRKHHYCPRSYLAFFTEEKNEDGTLWAIEKASGHFRKSSPAKEAHERDFYFVEVERDKDPYFLEAEFGKIESGAKIAIDEINRTHKIPTGEAFSFLVNFVALQATRVPHRLTWMHKTHERLIKHTMKIVTERTESLELALRDFSPAEKARLSKVSYDQFKKFVDEERYKLEIDRGFLLSGLLKMASTIVDCLSLRNWTVLVSDSNARFVTSDNPVGLNWIKPIRGPYPPGYGLNNTWVTMPLSDRTALMSTFEDYPEKIVMSAAQVATINNFSIQHASRYIYSVHPDFAWYSKDDGVAGRDALAEALKSEEETPDD